jgi:hypothetical protein
MILLVAVSLFLLAWLAANVAVSGKVLSEYMRHDGDERTQR